MRKQNWYLSITIVFIFMGILLSFQFKAQNRLSGDLTMQRTESLIAMVRDLSDKRQKLNAEITDLYKTLTIQTENSKDEAKLEANLEAQMNKLSIVTGTMPIKGPGLTVTIDQFMPILYIDIIYLVNELWAAGAEAIAVNDQRITGNSNIFYAEDDHNMFITVNNRKLDYPIVITAIGESNNLEKGLTIPGGIIDNLSLFRAYPQLVQSKSLTVPALQTAPVKIFISEYTPPPPIITAPAGELPKT